MDLTNLLPKPTTMALRRKVVKNVNVGSTERLLSALGGAVLTYYGLKKNRTLLGKGLTTTGSALLMRGLSGFCPVNQAINRNTANTRSASLEIRKTIVVEKPRSEVFAYWRQLENLPQFMEHLAEVKQLDQKRSHWKARVAKGMVQVEWEAEIVAEKKNHQLAWRSLPGSEIENSGEVVFEEGNSPHQTVVQALIVYRPPAGAVGEGVANLLNPAFKKMVKQDLKQFKQVLEQDQA